MSYASHSIEHKNHWLHRMIRRITRQGDCWLFTTSLNKKGYSHFKFRGERYAHRFSYWMFNGDIPKGMYVCHSCDRPNCVNPHHLFLGTPTDNHRDMCSKGRDNFKRNIESFRGENHPDARFTVDDVVNIRSCDMSTRELAKLYNVSCTAIYCIRRRKTWKHVP